MPGFASGAAAASTTTAAGAMTVITANNSSRSSYSSKLDCEKFLENPSENFKIQYQYCIEKEHARPNLGVVHKHADPGEFSIVGMMLMVLIVVSMVGIFRTK
jgi:hypothetical protein